MMQVQVLCHFCHKRLKDKPEEQWPFDGSYFKFYCEPCKTYQIFTCYGKPINYWFRVSEYLCHFWIEKQIFQILKLNKAQLTLNFIPQYITPYNTTDNRIKTLILLS